MDIEVMLEDMKCMPELNPTLANGFSYERMKDAPEYVHSVLKSAFSSLAHLGFSYHGYEYLPLYESVHAMSRTHRNNSKRALEVTHTSAFPISYRLRYQCPRTGAVSIMNKTTLNTFICRGNIWTNKDSKYIVSPKLGDRVFSLDRDKIFVSISRSRIVFIRTPYFFNLDGRVVSTDIHRAKLYYESMRAQQSKQKVVDTQIPTLVNYMLCESGLTGMFKDFYNVDIKYCTAEDFKEEDYPSDKWAICRSHGNLKRRGRQTDVMIMIPSHQMTPELFHVIAAVYFILDSKAGDRSLEVSELENPMGWIRALTSWAVQESNDIAAIEKVMSHIESVKGYIDFTTRQRFQREGYNIRNIYDLFKYVIQNFPVIAATHNVASLENKALSIVPDFTFRLTSSIFRMMFELQKQAQKKALSKPQVEKLVNALWKEEAALSRITQETNVRNLDNATDVYLFKATRLIEPQAKRGPGSKKIAEMGDPAFFFHWSKIGLNSYQFTNKSAPTAIDSINHFAQLTKDDVLEPHPEAMPAIRNIRLLTEGK